MDDDFDLLADYTATGSHAAFDALVKRHADFVYSAARRRVGSADLADEVTQATFIVLARKAKQIGRRESLSAWLYRVAKYAAIDALRRRSTRQKHERQAARPEADMAEVSLADEIAPHLDAALDRLATRDREAVLLRFFREQTLEQIGQTQHVAASTVQRRLDGALQRIGLELKRRGVAPASIGSGTAIAGSTLAGAIALTTTAAPQTATAGVLALATASSALSTSTAGPIGLAKGTMHAMNLIKLKFAAAAIAGVLTIGAGGVAITSAIAQSRQPSPGQSGSAVQSAQPAAAAPAVTTAGADVTRQFATQWTSVNFSIATFNPAVEANRRGSTSQTLNISFDLSIIDPTNIVGTNRFSDVKITKMIDEAGNDVSALKQDNLPSTAWYQPLMYSDVTDPATNRFVQRLRPQQFNMLLRVDGRVPPKLGRVEGSVGVLVAERVDHVDVPFKVSEQYTEVLPGKRVRFTKADRGRDNIAYSMEAPPVPSNSGMTRRDIAAPIGNGNSLPDKFVIEQYWVDAAGKPIDGDRRHAFGGYQDVSATGGSFGASGAVAVAMRRYDIAVNPREVRVPVVLTNIDLPHFQMAAQVLPSDSLTAAPRVVRTVPPADTAVDPALSEMRITFDQPMLDGNWSFVQERPETYPQIDGKPRFEDDGRTCVLPVKLKPAAQYVVMINSLKFNSFMNRDKVPAVPYTLRFQTRP